MCAEIQIYKINRDMFNTSNLKQTVDRYINAALWQHFNDLCLFAGIM